MENELESSCWISITSALPHKSLPKEGTENIVVWCGWVMPALYLPNKSLATCWYTIDNSPGGEMPIFHVTHWRIILPPPPPICESSNFIILHWASDDNYIMIVQGEDGRIRKFPSYEEAQIHAETFLKQNWTIVELIK